ncbi:MAG TPA: FAD-dependent oxidoreductase, partial [Polyangiaceae bacterium]|nr:FAD-dependent oxidoreductase [Polyangiaceae bacterium]
VPQFIRKIATGNVKGSARTIFESNILGMSCSRVCPVEVLCVGKCVYNDMHMQPINIGKLQRYSTDQAFDEKWDFFEAGAPTGKSVGLIGGGPASLACAHELRRFGHAATIYEKRPVLGGLNTTGVAPYKMKADRSVEELEWILAIGGIDVKTNVQITVGELGDLEKKHDAIFFGVGLGADTAMKIPGADLANVHGAVDWIEKMKTSRVSVEGMKHAVVVGGGNTALDAVREARGLGIERVTMLYRGVEEAMSGYGHEWKAGETEGCRAEWRVLPVAFEGNGKVERVKCVKLDAQKKPIAGTEFTIDADLVLVAIGQAKLADFKAAMNGKKNVFAGGDFENGGKEVVNAAAEGKAAAKKIHAFLSGAK